MPTEIRIPEVSATRDTTILLKWLKREGDEVKESGALSYYRGVVVHEGFFDNISNKHNLDDILDVTTHLHDLLIRVILKLVGYSGHYQPMTTRFPEKAHINWVKPGTESSKLGYGLH